MWPLLALTRRERDHTNGSPNGRASDVPSDVASCYFSVLLRSSYVFRRQCRSHLFFSYIIRWFLGTAPSRRHSMEDSVLHRQFSDLDRAL